MSLTINDCRMCSHMVRRDPKNEFNQGALNHCTLKDCLCWSDDSCQFFERKKLPSVPWIGKSYSWRKRFEKRPKILKRIQSARLKRFKRITSEKKNGIQLNLTACLALSLR